MTFWHFFVALILVFDLFLKKVLKWFLHVLKKEGVERGEKYPFIGRERKPFSAVSTRCSIGLLWGGRP